MGNDCFQREQEVLELSPMSTKENRPESGSLDSKAIKFRNDTKPPKKMDSERTDEVKEYC